MASGRFLSVSIADDDKLSRLSITAELIYLKAIPHLDRDGMLTGRPGLLYSKVCPAREELFGQTQALIDEWVKVGLVIRFMIPEGPVLFFTGFAKNNNLPHYERERASKFPPPPGYTRTEKGIVKADIESAPEEPEAVATHENADKTPVLDQVLELLHKKEPQFDSEDQDQDQDQEKEEEAAAGARAFLAESEADKDGRFTVQLVSDTNLFFVLGATARQRAASLEDTYDQRTIRKAISTLVERHHEMVDAKGRGIHDPIGFLAKILHEDFKTADEVRTVKVEVRLVPNEFCPDGTTVYSTMSLATARKGGFKIVEHIQ